MRICHPLKRKAVHHLIFRKSLKNLVPHLVATKLRYPFYPSLPAWVLKDQFHWEGILLPIDDSAAVYVSSSRELSCHMCHWRKTWSLRAATWVHFPSVQTLRKYTAKLLQCSLGAVKATMFLDIIH